MDKIKRIYILGGTHGNEFTGAYIVNNWNAVFSKEFLNTSIEIIPMLSNKKAFLEKKRYVDRDLNRSFAQEDLKNINLCSYEDNRAKVINSIIGPKKNNSSFIIDMHTTNASMGITLMTSTRDIYKLNLIKYITDNLENVKVIFTDDEDTDRPFLNSISKNNLLIELGGIANNILRHDTFEKMTNIVRLTIEYLNKIQNGSVKIQKNIKTFAFSIVKEVKFPLDNNGNIMAMIHKDIQDKDYIKKIDKTTNIFRLFDGTVLTLNEEGEYYMSFINESAYYTEKIAFYLMKKTILTPCELD